MTFNDIKYCNPINDIDPAYVEELAQLIKTKGWLGCPMLVYGDNLLTGSHRLAALKKLYNDGVDIDDLEVAEDITDIVEDKLAKFENDHGYIPDIDYQNIGWLLDDTWVEQYRDEIAEW